MSRPPPPTTASRRRSALLAFVLGAGACSERAEPASGEAAPADPTPVKAEVPASHFAQDYPSLATRGNQDVWVAYQAWDGVADRVELSLLTAFGQEVTPVYSSPTHLLGTALAADERDGLHVVWCEQNGQDGRWELRGVEVGPLAAPGGLGAVSEPVTLAGGPGRRCLLPRLVADPAGRLLLVWMEIAGTTFAIRARVREPGRGWGDECFVSEPGRSAWAPDVTAVAAGRFAVVWDAAVDGDYDVHLARLQVDEGRPSVVWRSRLTDTPRYEAWPCVAAAGNRLYVAYETAQENWGREGSSNRLDHALHDRREIEIVAVEGERIAPLAVPFMAGVSTSLNGSCERPRILVDGGGNLTLFLRGLPLPGEIDDPTNPAFERYVEERGGAGVGWRTAIWFEYVSRWDGGEWSFGDRHQMGLPGSNGRSDAPAAAARLAGGGVAYAVVGDERERQTTTDAKGRQIAVDRRYNWWQPISRQPTQITTGRIAKGTTVGELPLGPASGLPGPRAPAAGDAPPAVTRLAGDGRLLRLALGDLHRHTDLSRCSSNWDGSFTDALRYAFDVAPLQFLAVTDHFEHMTRYDWWRNLAFMDAFDAPGRMVNLRAYERADWMSGHRNVVSGDGAIPLVGYRKSYTPDRDEARADTPADLWEHFASQQILTIPHTPAGMFLDSPDVLDWKSFDPTWDRVVEIFQGYRGSSEAPDAPRAIVSKHPLRFARSALDGGLHFGFVASSDHQSSYGAFAGAWVEEWTRGSVFEALHARRTFAATCKMALWAEWDGVPMGTSARREPGPTAGLVLEIDPFGRSVLQVELIVDGVVAQAVASDAAAQGSLADGRAGRLTFAGPELDVPAAGTRYAYVRVTTADGELGWTSPIRLGAEDWAGPDGPTGEEAPVVEPMVRTLSEGEFDPETGAPLPPEPPR